MKNVSKFMWLVFGLVLIGGGCATSEDNVMEVGEGDDIQVVEVTVEGDGEGVVEVVEDEDDLSAPAGDRDASAIEEALKGDEENEPIGGDPVIDANFTIEAGNFFFTPNSMRINAGDTVNLFFAANSGTHDFTIDEIGFSQSVVEGGSMTFTAPTTPGSYAYYCSIGSHRALGMEGVLIVE